MNKVIICILGFFSTLLISESCKNEKSLDFSRIPTDSVSVARGKILFTQYCTSCHNFKQGGIGPQLGGLTREVAGDWIKAFIHNPKELIDGGDARAQKLFSKYKTYMISFPDLDDKSLDHLLAFLHTKEKPVFQVGTDTAQALINPIPDTIPGSGIVVDLKFITQIPASDTSKNLLTRITKFDYQPESKELFLLDLRGKLYKLIGNKTSVYFDMAKVKPKFVHTPGLATGFGSFAFHPEFSKNGLLYTTHSEPPASAEADYGYDDSIPVTLQWVLTEWKTSTPLAPVFNGVSREMLRINVESVIHGVQEIVFNPRSKQGDEDYGLLYIGVGDGGSVEHGYPHLAHELTTIWGNVLRIDPSGTNSRNGKYGIPASNPFVTLNDKNILGEIYARGFRNPHRITWTQNGDMLVSNVGHGNIESLNRILPGSDFGWPLTEGPFRINIKADMKKVYPLPAEYSNYKFTYPAAMFDHDEGLAITGGYEYTGNSIPLLRGKFLFGDIPGGRLFYVNTTDIKQSAPAQIFEFQARLDGEVRSLQDVCGNKRVDLHFGRDADGEIYIMTKPDGKLYKIIQATRIQ